MTEGVLYISYDGMLEPLGQSQVLAYLERCRGLWKRGTLWLDLWERMIREGKAPSFARNRYVP